MSHDTYNKLTIKGMEIKEFLDKYSNDSEILNFEKIIPTTDKVQNQIKLYEYRKNKWGTPDFGAVTKIDKKTNTLEFTTPYTPPTEIIKKLANLEKGTEFNLQYLQTSNNYSGNINAVKYKDGKLFYENKQINRKEDFPEDIYGEPNETKTISSLQLLNHRKNSLVNYLISNGNIVNNLNDHYSTKNVNFKQFKNLTKELFPTEANSNLITAFKYIISYKEVNDENKNKYFLEVKNNISNKHDLYQFSSDFNAESVNNFLKQYKEQKQNSRKKPQTKKKPQKGRV
jgi:hypothetical protein